MAVLGGSTDRGWARLERDSGSGVYRKGRSLASGGQAWGAHNGPVGFSLPSV